MDPGVHIQWGSIFDLTPAVSTRTGKLILVELNDVININIIIYVWGSQKDIHKINHDMTPMRPRESITI